MNKWEFLSVLRSRLTGMPEEDMERSLEYYSEMIDDRIEDGMTEEEAVNAIGSIDDIVRQILAEAAVLKRGSENAVSNKRKGIRTWEVVLLVLGSPVWLPLLVAAASVLAAVYIVIWSVVIVLYAVDLSFAAGAAGGILGCLALLYSGSGAQGALLMGAGLVCAGIAVLLFLGFNQVTKGILLLSKKLLLCAKSCFVRKGEVQ